MVVGWNVGWVQSMGPCYGYFFLISDGVVWVKLFLLSGRREREREREIERERER